MSWFGSSLVNLKDQITTLTKEIVSEADEDEHRPKFVPCEKFDRLLKICEEKEDQLSQLQLEVEELRNGSKVTPVYELKSTQTENDTNACIIQSESLNPGTENAQEYENSASSSTFANEPAAQSLPSGYSECNPEKQIQNVLQKIQNLAGKNKLNTLQTLLKEVKCQYDLEKAKQKMSASAISFPSSKTSHGTDETMSNDSERSDDSFLNDFEILKMRSASSKSLEEYALCQAENQITTAGNSQLNEFESSNGSKVDSNGGKILESNANGNKASERDELNRVLDTNSRCWEEVFGKIKSSEEGASFWNELYSLVSKNNESLKNYTRSLYRENATWDEYYRSLSHDRETLKKREEKLAERELRLAENDRSRTTTFVERVSELDSCRKKLEDFNESLHEVSREVYDELKALREENARLMAELETKEDDREVEAKLDSLEQTIRERDELKCRLDETLAEHDSLSERLEQTTREREELSRHLEQTKEATSSLNEELQTANSRLNEIEENMTAILQRDNSDIETERLAHHRTREELAARETRITALEERNRAFSEEIDSLTSKFAEEIDTLKDQVMTLEERKKRLENDMEMILRNEDAVGRFKLEEIVKLLERYFVTSSQEQRSDDDIWRKLLEIVEVETPTNAQSDNEELLSEIATCRASLEQLRMKLEESEANLAEKCDQIEQLRDRAQNLEKTLETTSSEREQLIASLKEKHNESVAYHTELQRIHGLLVAEAEQKKEYELQIKELNQKLSNNGNVAAELERLRQHLIATEDSYTNELVNGEDQINELKAKVAEYEERIKSINEAQTSVNVRTNQITESLQREIKSLAEEKTKLASNLKACQVELQRNIQDVQNLRSALDLFHRNKDSEIFQATEKLRTDMELLKNENRVLDETIYELRGNLTVMKQGFEELDDLRNELNNKEDVIKWHKSQALKMQNELEEAKKKIAELQTDAESKYKLNLLKNIVLRYILGNTDVMKTQALQILAEVLDFSIDERRKIGLSVAGNKSDRDTQPEKNSLIDEFIRFVEKESSPESDHSRSRKISGQNALLSSAPSLPDVMLPTLSQFPANRNSRYILKDVLQ